MKLFVSSFAAFALTFALVGCGGEASKPAVAPPASHEAMANPTQTTDPAPAGEGEKKEEAAPAAAGEGEKKEEAAPAAAEEKKDAPAADAKPEAKPEEKKAE